MLVCLVVNVVGCGGDDPASRIAAANDSNIRRLGNLYKAYQLRHANQGPADEAAFRQYLHETPPARLERMQVDPNNIDGLFISERDGQPFVIRYGVSGGLGTVEVVVFEQQGRDGDRQVGLTSGTVEGATADRYEKYLRGEPPATPGVQSSDGAP